jgi:preprotein translocase subunit YajC
MTGIPLPSPMFALAQPAQSQNMLVSLLPFALMIGIFYVLVLLPMRRRQKKVQDFQSALKAGDRVITTSGMYGLITKLNDKSVQLQIADKVRVEIARASIGGYQGEEPVVQPDSGSL